MAKSYYDYFDEYIKKRSGLGRMGSYYTGAKGHKKLHADHPEIEQAAHSWALSQSGDMTMSNMTDEERLEQEAWDSTNPNMADNFGGDGGVDFGDTFGGLADATEDNSDQSTSSRNPSEYPEDEGPTGDEPKDTGEGGGSSSEDPDSEGEEKPESEGAGGDEANAAKDAAKAGKGEAASGAAEASAGAAETAATAAEAAEGAAAAEAAVGAAAAAAETEVATAAAASLFANPWTYVVLLILVIVIFFLFQTIAAAFPSADTKTTATSEEILKYCTKNYGKYDSQTQLKSIFGSTESEVSSQLQTIDFPYPSGKIRVHEKAAPCFDAVAKELANINYKITETGGTFVWRANVNNSSVLSLHSFGIATDVNPDKNPNGGGSPGNCETDMPKEFVNVWKKYGFRWGGNYNSTCDAMHYEWLGGAPGVAIPALGGSENKTTETDLGAKIVAYAKKQEGKPYLWGAAGPDSFDCSGLVQYVYKHVANITLPHSSASQFTSSRLSTIKKGSEKPGDLVFFGSPIHHVGIVAGNGKMWEAPHTGSFVKLSSYKNRSDVAGFRRLK